MANLFRQSDIKLRDYYNPDNEGLQDFIIQSFLAFVKISHSIHET